MLKFKLDCAPVGEIVDKGFMLCAVMGGREPHCQLDSHDVRGVPTHRLDFIGDSKQCEDEETLILRFVPVIRDAFL